MQISYTIYTNKKNQKRVSFFLNIWFLLPQVRDYSGMYTVKLIPCTSPPSLEYTLPPVCNPREPLTFDLDIRFQQVQSSRLILILPVKV